MRKQIYIINKASGEGGGDGGDMNQYAFKTLWKEATKAVGHIMTGITQLASHAPITARPSHNYSGKALITERRNVIAIGASTAYSYSL